MRVSNYVFPASEIPAISLEYLLLLEMRGYFDNPRYYPRTTYETAQVNWSKAREAVLNKSFGRGILGKLKEYALERKIFELKDKPFEEIVTNISKFHPVQRAIILQNMRQLLSFSEGSRFLDLLETSQDSSVVEALSYAVFFQPTIESGASLIGNFILSETRQQILENLSKAESFLLDQKSNLSLADHIKDLVNLYVIPRKSAAIFFEEGMYWYRNGELDSAIRAFEESIYQGKNEGFNGIAPSYPFLYLSICHGLMSIIKKPEKDEFFIEEDFEKVIQWGMLRGEAFRRIAIGLLNHGKKKMDERILVESAKMFEKAIEHGDCSSAMLTPINMLQTILDEKYNININIRLPEALWPDTRNISMNIDNAIENALKKGDNDEAIRILNRVEYAIKKLPSSDAIPLYSKLAFYYQNNIGDRERANKIYLTMIDLHSSIKIPFSPKLSEEEEIAVSLLGDLHIEKAVETFVVNCLEHEDIEESKLRKVLFVTERMKAKAFLHIMKRNLEDLSFNSQSNAIDSIESIDHLLDTPYDDDSMQQFISVISSTNPMLAFLSFSNCYAVLLIRRGSIKVLHKIIEIPKVLELYHSAYKYFRRVDKGNDVNEINEDYSLVSKMILPSNLWSILDEVYKGDGSLIVSTHGILHFLQVGWLIHDGHFFAEQYAFSQVLSLSHWYVLKALSKKVSRRFTHYLGLADPSLPAAVKTVNEISQKHFNNSSKIFGKDETVSKNDLLHLIKNTQGIIDLETHGKMLESQKQRNGGQESKVELKDPLENMYFRFYNEMGNIEYITAKDIIDDMGLCHFDLIMLAFCYGGSPDVRLGGQMTGWPRIFSLSGGRSVLAKSGLILEYSDINFRILTTFIDNLLIKKKDKAEALKWTHVQILEFLRKEGKKDRLDPFCWCWTLWGDPF
jgi:tetratricopeptide (TPR) repeat protein